MTTPPKSPLERAADKLLDDAPVDDTADRDHTPEGWKPRNQRAGYDPDVDRKRIRRYGV